MHVTRKTTPPRRTGSGLKLASFLTLGLASALPQAAHAGLFTWDGGGPDSNWSTALNWLGDSAPPSDGTADLLFAGTTRLSPVAQTGYSLHSLGFSSGAGGFTLSGSQLTLGAGGITQSSASAETVNNDLLLGADQTWSLTSGAGLLTVGGTVSTNGKALAVSAAAGTNAALTGAISGAGGLTLTGGGTLTLSHINSFTGATQITGGTLAVANVRALASSSAVTIGTGATLDTSAINFQGDSVILRSLSGGGTLTMGNIAYVSVGSSNADSTFGGALVSQGAWLFKDGTGTLTLSGDSESFAGIMYINSGTVALAAGGTLSGGGKGAGTLSIADFNPNPSAPAAFVQNGGTVNIGELTAGFSQPGQTGTYTLNAGSLITDGEFLGFEGKGVFVQNGGTNTTGELDVGTDGAGGVGPGSASYTLTAGTLGATTRLVIGGDVNGTWTQTGGAVTAGAVTLGDFQGVTGAATLAGVASTWSVQSLALGANGGTGTLGITGGASVAVSGATALAGAGSAITIDGGTFSTGGLSLGNGRALTLSDPASGAPALTVGGDGSDSAFSNAISDATSGPGTVAKVGGGTLTLSGVLSNTGGYQGNGGTLAFSGARVQPGFGSLTANSGAIEYAGGTRVIGGFLDGTGAQTVGAGGAAFTGTQLLNGAHLAVGGPATFHNVNSGGAVTVGAGQSLGWTGGVQSSAGSLTVGNGATATVTSFESDGVVTISPGGTLSNTGGTNLVLGGGSRTSLGTPAAPGGTLSTSAGTTIELNGGLLVNNGTQTGTLDVNYGGLAKGSGTFGTVSVGDGGRFSPGNSPGTATVGGLTFGAGGGYQFEINSAGATPGNGQDFIHDTGTLTITAGTTPSSVFTIGVFTLNSSNQAAALTDFDPTRPYSYTLLTADGGITGFSPGEFAVDTGGFQNGLSGGGFSVSQNGNNLLLNFAPAAAPEPSGWAGLGLGALSLASLALKARRRRA